MFEGQDAYDVFGGLNPDVSDRQDAYDVFEGLGPDVFEGQNAYAVFEGGLTRMLRPRDGKTPMLCLSDG